MAAVNGIRCNELAACPRDLLLYRRCCIEYGIYYGETAASCYVIVFQVHEVSYESIGSSGWLSDKLLPQVKQSSHSSISLSDHSMYMNITEIK